MLHTCNVHNCKHNKRVRVRWCSTLQNLRFVVLRAVHIFWDLRERHVVLFICSASLGNIDINSTTLQHVVRPVHNTNAHTVSHTTGVLCT